MTNFEKLIKIPIKQTANVSLSELREQTPHIRNMTYTNIRFTNGVPVFFYGRVMLDKCDFKNSVYLGVDALLPKWSCLVFENCKFVNCIFEDGMFILNNAELSKLVSNFSNRDNPTMISARFCFFED